MIRLSMLNLAAVLGMQDKHEEAESMLRRVIDLGERYAGGDHSMLYTARANLAEILDETGRLEEAGRIREQLLVDVRTEFGEEYFLTVALTLDLADQRIVEGNAAAARELVTDFANRNATAHASMYVLAARELMARARFVDGEHAAAIADMARICKRKREALGENRQSTLICMSHRADMLAATGQREQAVALLEDVLESQTRSLGADNSGTLDTRARLLALRVEAFPASQFTH